MNKKTHFYLLIIIVISIFSSCYSGKPLTSNPSENNSTYKVEYLFEHEGCKVYRFYDRSSYIYFTNCTGNATAISNDSIKTTRYTTIKADY